jgi:lactoylglutathione lyase
MKARFVYVGLRVKDLDESVEFYTKFLGMKEGGRQRMEEKKGDLAVLKSSDGKFVLELTHYDEDSPYYTDYVVGEGLDHLGFGVDNLETTLRAAKRAGYRIAGDIKTPKSRWAYVEDPNGVWIELFED